MEMLKKLRMLIRNQLASANRNIIFKFLPTMEAKGLSSAFVNQEVAIEAGVQATRMDELVIPNAMETSQAQINNIHMIDMLY